MAVIFASNLLHILILRSFCLGMEHLKDKAILSAVKFSMLQWNLTKYPYAEVSSTFDLDSYMHEAIPRADGFGVLEKVGNSPDVCLFDVCHLCDGLFTGLVSFSGPHMVLAGPGDRWCLKQEKGALLSSLFQG